MIYVSHDKVKCSNKSNIFNSFFYNIFSYIEKCLKIDQLNISKKIKKDYKKSLRKISKSF